MKVKELYKKYDKDYSILIFGRPLDKLCTPFTCLPRDKELNDCEVVDMRIEEKETTLIDLGFLIGKPGKSRKVKGTIYAYVK